MQQQWKNKQRIKSLKYQIKSLAFVTQNQKMIFHIETAFSYSSSVVVTKLQKK